MHHFVVIALCVFSAASATQTIGGKECVFPFEYAGQSYNECIDDGWYPWCGTVEVVVDDSYSSSEWGLCKEEANAEAGLETTTWAVTPEPATPEPTTPEPTIPESTTPEPTTPEPTTLEATTPPEPEPTPESELTSEPKPLPECVFPFTYEGEAQYECLPGTLGSWCATTNDYDNNKNLWKYCPQEATPAPVCASEYIYKGTTYTGCITKGNYGKAWCATTDNYDRDRDWIPCEVPTEEPVIAEEKPECVIPFTYKDETYDKCTDEDNYGVYWCSTTDNFEEDRKYRTCPYPARTTEGEECSFPFKYRGVIYDSCTTIYNGGVPWCSLTYEYNRQYGNCDI